MAKVSVSLPDYLMEFVREEVAAKGGHLSLGEYVHTLVLGAYLRKHQDDLEQLVHEGLNSGPSSPMTQEDWEEIRRKGVARLAEEKKHAARNQKKSGSRKRPAGSFRSHRTLQRKRSAAISSGS